jgi:DNA-binding response OmpR family regulator
MRLLIVEDQEDCALALAKRLEMAGHEVRVCNNPCSALLAAPEFQPDAVLLDIGLPEMDGWQLAPLLREAMAEKQTVIIAISGYQTENDLMLSRHAGIDHHLPKPNYFDRLSMILKQVQLPS